MANKYFIAPLTLMFVQPLFSPWQFMTSNILLVLLMLSVNSQLCAKQVDYTKCTTQAALDVANCNSLVKDVPDRAYYQCLCEGNNKLLQCYQIW